MKRILSIDGGGIRGIMPAVVCEGIEEETGLPCYRAFDLIAGTSVGGIITIALSLGIPAKDITKLLNERSSEIFAGSFLRKSVQLLRSKYSGKSIRNTLHDALGTGQYISEACKTEILIPAYELETRMPRFFRRSRARERAASDFDAADVALATSAAPTYFPPARIRAASGSESTYIDGGVFANNPAMCAFVEAKRLWPNEREFLILSLGTGNNHIRIPDTQRWGLLSWIIKGSLVSIVFDGVSDTAAFHIYNMVPIHRYYRISMQTDLELDDISEESRKALQDMGLALRQETEYLRGIEALKASLAQAGVA